MTNTKKGFKVPRIPGDLIIYPMIIGVILNSFIPQFLNMGGFLTAIKGGTAALVGIFLFFLGASLDIKSTPQAVKRGGIVIITKVLASVGLGLAGSLCIQRQFLGTFFPGNYRRGFRCK